MRRYKMAEDENLLLLRVQTLGHVLPVSSTHYQIYKTRSEYRQRQLINVQKISQFQKKQLP